MGSKLSLPTHRRRQSRRTGAALGDKRVTTLGVPWGVLGLTLVLVLLVCAARWPACSISNMLAFVRAMPRAILMIEAEGK